ncbi:uncharacterized protein LOC125680043 isoform X4 [Ostrea edulis]|uniref:uncharacterized protein LOC125680043 isoform X4 n=1 Tax=Ostrea edulis TaxID=37623 RepID=UPI0024AF8A7C|nr:uncharacterized protein LOC125680043 isoform X4 [Ostrea edulis]
MHVLSLQEEKKATIPKDCDRPPATTSKNVKNSEFDSKRENNGPFSNGFCEIYFWVSLLAIPLVVCVITTILYVFLMRKPRGPIPNGNISPQARLNAKSTCYANANGTNEYDDEVQYSLAQDI